MKTCYFFPLLLVLTFLAPGAIFAQSQTLTIEYGDYETSNPDEAWYQVFPVPAASELTLQLASNYQVETIQIVNMQGVVVEEIDLGTQALPFSKGLSLDPGMYSIQFLGIGAFFGKVNWGLALTVGIGVILIAGTNG